MSLLSWIRTHSIRPGRQEATEKAPDHDSLQSIVALLGEFNTRLENGLASWTASHQATARQRKSDTRRININLGLSAFTTVLTILAVAAAIYAAHFASQQVSGLNQQILDNEEDQRAWLSVDLSPTDGISWEPHAPPLSATGQQMWDKALISVPLRAKLVVHNVGHHPAFDVHGQYNVYAGPMPEAELQAIAGSLCVPKRSIDSDKQNKGITVFPEDSADISHAVWGGDYDTLPLDEPYSLTTLRQPLGIAIYGCVFYRLHNLEAIHHTAFAIIVQANIPPFGATTMLMEGENTPLDDVKFMPLPLAENAD